MVRKWGAMYYLRKLEKFSMIALFLAVPSLAFADTTLTSQTYVDTQDNFDEKLSNKLNGTSTPGQKIGDLTDSQAQTMYPSAAAVKEYAVKIAQGVGTNNANVGKTLIVNSSGNLELGTIDALPTGSAANQMLQYNSTNSTWDVVNIDTTPTAGHTVPVTSGGVYDVVNNKQTKPSSGVANGKVLTYTGTDVDTQVSADYVKVPNFDPSSSVPNSPTFSYIWVQ